jgi:hypothetical protein
MKDSEKEIFEYLNAHLDESVKASMSSTQVMAVTRCVSKWARDKILSAAFDHAKILADKIQKRPEEIKDSVLDGEHDPDFLKELSSL